MSRRITEYQEEYCHLGGHFNRKRVIKSAADAPVIFPDVEKNYDVQPVGGRCMEKARQAAIARREAAKAQPVYDADFTTTAYSANNRGCPHVAPNWRDPRWSNEPRIATTTLYHPADRDPAHRPNFYTYRTTRMIPTDTPCKPLAVPDVHKLRYMHNDYMTRDDWY